MKNAVIGTQQIFDLQADEEISEEFSEFEETIEEEPPKHDMFVNCYIMKGDLIVLITRYSARLFDFSLK